MVEIRVDKKIETNGKTLPAAALAKTAPETIAEQISGMHERKMELLKMQLESIDHDFGGPMMKVLGMLEEMEKDCEESWKPEIEKIASDMEEGYKGEKQKMRERGRLPTMQELDEFADKMVKLGKDILIFSKKVGGELGKKMEDADLRIIGAARELKEISNQKPKIMDLQQYASGMAKIYGEKKANIEFSAEERDYKVHGLEFSVKTILHNILFNARDAVEKVKGGKVRVSLSKTEGMIELVVVNSAKIDEELAEKIDSQEVFEKGFTTSGREYRGRGLAIVKFFAEEELGGRARTFTSEPLEGETGRAFGITISIPEYVPEVARMN